MRAPRALASQARRFWLVSLLSGALCPAVAQPENLTPYDPQIIERHLVDIGAGRRLNVTCVGEGAPAAVFMQGGEGSILNWRNVEKPIAAITRVCFYDRAGFGYSDPPAGSVTALSETDDLHALLKAADIRGPVVLVGHSIGGFYATMYADRFRKDVAGLVLVDPGFAGQTQAGRTPRQHDIEVACDRRGEARLAACASLARQGLLSLENTQGCMSFPAPTSPAEAAYLANMASHPYWYEAELSQSQNYAFGPDSGPSLDTREEAAARRSFGDMPIVVMSSERTARDAWQDDAAFRTFVAAWRAGHDRLAARSTRGRSFVVPNAGHFIQRDRPDAVIAAIKEVVQAARAGG